MKNRFKIKNKLWIWGGGGAAAAWYFVSIPPEISLVISEKYHHLKRGWGSLSVKILFNKQGKKEKQIILETSLFPNKKEGIYILPIKKSIRTQLGVQDGDILNFTLEIKV